MRRKLSDSQRKKRWRVTATAWRQRHSGLSRQQKSSNGRFELRNPHLGGALFGSVSPALSIMYQPFKSVNRSWVPVAREVISLLLWVTQRLLRMLLRRPMLDIVLLVFVLWLITRFINTVVIPQPEPVLLQPAAVFEGR